VRTHLILALSNHAYLPSWYYLFTEEGTRMESKTIFFDQCNS
jgi:hypothetical protein